MPEKLQSQTLSILRKVGLFSGLPLRVVRQVAACATSITVPANTMLRGDDAEAQGLLVVVSGRLGELLVSARNEERILRIVHTGETSGEAELFSPATAKCHVKALVDSRIMRISADHVQALFDGYRIFRRNTLTEVAKRALAVLDDIETASCRSSEQRFVRYLTRQFITDPDSSSIRLHLPISKSEFASRLGIAPATLSRVLRTFSDASLIDMRGRRIDIPDVNRLREYTVPTSLPA